MTREYVLNRDGSRLVMPVADAQDLVWRTHSAGGHGDKIRVHIDYEFEVDIDPKWAHIVRVTAE